MMYASVHSVVPCDLKQREVSVVVYLPILTLSSFVYLLYSPLVLRCHGLLPQSMPHTLINVTNFLPRERERYRIFWVP